MHKINRDCFRPLFETKYPPANEPSTNAAAPKMPYAIPISDVNNPKPPSSLEARKNSGTI